MGFRAVSRVLTLLAVALGITSAPCPHTIITWVIRLTLVRLDAARTLRGFPLSQAPFPNGLIWMIESSIGPGTGKLLAVVACDAHHHHLAPGALSFQHVHCSGVCVADAWTGDAIAEVLKRLSAQMGRPAASLQDGAVHGIKPSPCWRNKACRALVLTTSHTLLRGCSHVPTTIAQPSRLFCQPVVAFRAHCNTPFSRVSCLPMSTPQPALCMDTAS